MFSNTALTVSGSNEVASARETNMAIARIQARYSMALHNPRDLIKEVEPKISELCSRREFADTAIYEVVVGGHYEKSQWVIDYDIDLNIRAAEQLMVCYRNIMTEVNTVHEDDQLRRVSFEMTDMESGVTHKDEFTIYKTQERKKLKRDQDAFETRTNSKDELIYVVKCTNEEVQKKQNLQVSRKMRKMFFRLFPADLKIKARRWIDKTIESSIKENIKDERAKITIAFSKHGVTGEELEELIGESILRFSSKDIKRLKTIWQSLDDGISRWSDYVSQEEPLPVTDGKLGKPENMDTEPKNDKDAENGAIALGGSECLSGGEQLRGNDVEVIKEAYNLLNADGKHSVIRRLYPDTNQQRIHVTSLSTDKLKELEEILIENGLIGKVLEKRKTKPTNLTDDELKDKVKMAWLGISTEKTKSMALEMLNKKLDDPLQRIIVAQMDIETIRLLDQVFEGNGIYE